MGDSEGNANEQTEKLYVMSNLPSWAIKNHDENDETENLASSVQASMKTATTALKEFCDKQKLNPKFDLISSAGGNFVYEAKLDSLVFTAEASSKKNARKKCSESMLLGLKDRMSEQDKVRFLKPYFAEEQIGEIRREVAENFVDKNPIGELQEYSVALQWPCPEYKLIDETGPAHMRSFVMQCTLNKLVSVGNAKAKRLAKREAAANMLKQLGQMKFTEGGEKSSTGGGITCASIQAVVGGRGGKVTEEESLVQLEDSFAPPFKREIETGKNNNGEPWSTEWQSEEKKARLDEEFLRQNKLDLRVESHLNTYKVEITPIDANLVMANVDSQIPSPNYLHELHKYLSVNGIKYQFHHSIIQSIVDEPLEKSENRCTLQINFDQPLSFMQVGVQLEEVQHETAREALIHLIKQQNYKELTFAQLNRLLPKREPIDVVLETKC